MFVKALGDEEFNLTKAIAGLPRYKTLGIQNSLPPVNPISWVYQDWHQYCNGGQNELEEHAAIVVLSHAFGGSMIPLVDMLNHREKQWLNIKIKHKKETLSVYASRHIYSGEQIYQSYYTKNNDEEMEKYGTPTLFRDYGFVEEMPQTWMFPDMNLAFIIDEMDNEEEDGTPQYDIIEWIDDIEPSLEDIEAFEEKLEYIQERIQILEDRDLWADVPLYEWLQTKEYMNAMEFSVQTVLNWHNENEHYPNACIISGECTVSIDRYRDLDEQYTTDQESSYHQTAFVEKQNHLETFKSQYQKISFFKSKDNGNTCMDLEKTIQICGSYRPHYHEYMVHQIAKFLPLNSIKRVLFVGGGDSMLLHEALKYPSVELVVGLELDQKVTRGCFKHFGTQPHFDDDRVEWWFGDASKSLLMLPKDYFASFDLVLVDLSETVMSFSVTNELTVIEALTLLVKPDGIFVKNEVYFNDLMKIFPYTAQLRWYDTPVVYQQVMAMGSRMVDFMNPMKGPALTEHGVDTLVVRKSDDIEDDFDFYHDYSFNAAPPHLCDNLASKDHDETQVRSPGILQIVEVEQVSGDMSMGSMQSSVMDALRVSGMNVLATGSYQSMAIESNKMLYVIMKEGYVVARAMAEKKYVGLDVFFWGSMHKQQSVTNALVAAVGGEAALASSYRIITGGMFGVDSWEEDQQLRGPQFKELCKTLIETAPKVSNHEGAAEEADLYVAVEQGLSLIGRAGLKVAMLVSNKDTMKAVVDDHCAKIADLEAVSEIVTLSCPSMANFNRYAEGANESLTACEKHLYEVLLDASQNGLFDVILIDGTADKLTSSILLELLSHRREFLVSRMMKNDSVVVSSTLDRGEYSWRKHLLLHMKDDVFTDNPDTAFVDVLFENSSTDSEFNLMMTSYGIENFTNRLNATVVGFNSDGLNSLTARVQLLSGGDWVSDSEITISRVYLPEDYNQTGPLLQWMSQDPTGHQAIVQLERDQSNESHQSQVMTKDLLMYATNAAIRGLNAPGLTADSVKTFCDVGDGCLVVGLYESGSLIILWDGRSHIDINLFSYDEDVSLVDVCVDSFLGVLPGYATMLRDEQPRGFGRVVSYRRDLDEMKEPHWATI
jgi:spermidine synthase